MIRTVSATRYVAPLRQGGSLPALVEADDESLYVLKFTGAGQGPKALIAELVAGEIGRAGEPRRFRERCIGGPHRLYQGEFEYSDEQDGEERRASDHSTDSWKKAMKSLLSARDARQQDSRPVAAEMKSRVCQPAR